MMNDEPPVDDWQGYEPARLRNNEFHSEYLKSYSERGYEYGVLVAKNFMLISGGALIALPALAKLSNHYDEKMAILVYGALSILIISDLEQKEHGLA